MTTTVRYKGNTLTTVDNQTRTLLTSGKYLEDNITLTDVSSGGSANIEALTVTTNGSYAATGDVDGFSPITVNVSGGGDFSLATVEIINNNYDDGGQADGINLWYDDYMETYSLSTGYWFDPGQTITMTVVLYKGEGRIYIDPWYFSGTCSGNISDEGAGWYLVTGSGVITLTPGQYSEV